MPDILQLQAVIAVNDTQYQRVMAGATTTAKKFSKDLEGATGAANKLSAGMTATNQATKVLSVETAGLSEAMQALAVGMNLATAESRGLVGVLRAVPETLRRIATNGVAAGEAMQALAVGTNLATTELKAFNFETAAGVSAAADYSTAVGIAAIEAKNLAAGMTAASGTAKALAGGMTTAAESTKKLTVGIGRVGTAAVKLGENTGVAGESLDKFTAVAGGAGNEVKRLAADMAAAGAGARDMATQVGSANRAVKSMGTGRVAGGGAVANEPLSNLQKFQKFHAVINTASNVAIGVGGATAIGLLAGANAAAKFNQQMELAHTQAGDTQKQIESLSAAVLKLAPQVGAGPDELAKGLYHVASLGVPASQQMDVLRVAAQGAAVGVADIESTANALGATMVSGIKGITGASQAMGVLNAIVGAGNMRFENLNAALSTGLLAKARNFGLDIKDVGAALATLTDAGMRAQPAAMRLGQAFTFMGAPSKAAQKAMASIGLTATALAHDMRKPEGILYAMKDLKAHLDESRLSTEKQSQVISRMFGGGRSGSAVEALLQNLNRLDAKEKKITATTGDFGRMLSDTEKEAAFHTKQFEAEWKVFEISFGVALLPQLTKVVDGLRGLMDEFTKLPASTQANITKTVEVVAGILVVGGIFGKVIGFIADVKTAWMALAGTSAAEAVAVEAATAGMATATATDAAAMGASILLLSGPAGWIAGLVIAVAGLAVAWENNWGHIQDVTHNAVDGLGVDLYNWQQSLTGMAKDNDSLLGGSLDRGLAWAAGSLGSTNPGYQTMQWHSHVGMDPVAAAGNSANVALQNTTLSATSHQLADRTMTHVFDDIRTASHLSCAEWASKALRAGGAAGIPEGGIVGARALRNFMLHHGGADESMATAHPGDLIYYHGQGLGPSGHVGIYTGSGNTRYSSEGQVYNSSVTGFLGRHRGVTAEFIHAPDSLLNGSGPNVAGNLAGFTPSPYVPDTSGADKARKEAEKASQRAAKELQNRYTGYLRNLRKTGEPSEEDKAKFELSAQGSLFGIGGKEAATLLHAAKARDDFRDLQKVIEQVKATFKALNKEQADLTKQMALGSHATAMATKAYEMHRVSLVGMDASQRQRALSQEHSIVIQTGQLEYTTQLDDLRRKIAMDSLSPEKQGMIEAAGGIDKWNQFGRMAGSSPWRTQQSQFSATYKFGIHQREAKAAKDAIDQLHTSMGRLGHTEENLAIQTGGGAEKWATYTAAQKKAMEATAAADKVMSNLHARMETLHQSLWDAQNPHASGFQRTMQELHSQFGQFPDYTKGMKPAERAEFLAWLTDVKKTAKGIDFTKAREQLKKWNDEIDRSLAKSKEKLGGPVMDPGQQAVNDWLQHNDSDIRQNATQAWPKLKPEVAYAKELVKLAPDIAKVREAGRNEALAPLFEFSKSKAKELTDTLKKQQSAAEKTDAAFRALVISKGLLFNSPDVQRQYKAAMASAGMIDTNAASDQVSKWGDEASKALGKSTRRLGGVTQDPGQRAVDQWLSDHADEMKSVETESKISHAQNLKNLTATINAVRQTAVNTALQPLFEQARAGADKLTHALHPMQTEVQQLDEAFRKAFASSGLLWNDPGVQKAYQELMAYGKQLDDIEVKKALLKPVDLTREGTDAVKKARGQFLPGQEEYQQWLQGQTESGAAEKLQGQLGPAGYQKYLFSMQKGYRDKSVSEQHATEIGGYQTQLQDALKKSMELMAPTAEEAFKLKFTVWDPRSNTWVMTDQVSQIDLSKLFTQTEENRLTGEAQTAYQDARMKQQLSGAVSDEQRWRLQHASTWDKATQSYIPNADTAAHDFGQVYSMTHATAQADAYAGNVKDYITAHLKQQQQDAARATGTQDKIPFEGPALEAEAQRLTDIYKNLDVDKLMNWGKATEDAHKFTVFMQGVATNMEQVFNRSFEGLFQHGAKGFFSNFLQGFDQMLQQMAAKWLTAQAMMQLGHAIGGQAGGIFTAQGQGILGTLGSVAGAIGGHGHSAGAAGGAMGSQIGSIISGIAGSRAYGGPVSAGQNYLVGERGPEIVRMGRSGTVIPNNQIGGGSTVHQTVNNHFNIMAPDSSSFRQSRTQIATEYARTMGRQAQRNH